LLKKGILNPSKTKLKIKTDKEDIRQFRLIPKGSYIVAEVIYEVTEEALKKDNGKYASIDLGLNNLMTVASNVSKPFIINGRPLKSINHFYNKSKAKLQSILRDKKTSKKIQQLGCKRNNKITDYLHKASRFIINHLVSEGINTLIVGYNKEWKQEINIGSKNNQNFVQIPFTKLLQMLEYKCKLFGILFKKQEESYTSKCSFFDNEVVKKHELYAGKRVKRGLFRTGSNLMVNADVNGSLNIMKKAVGEVDFRYPIQVCSTPHKVKNFKTLAKIENIVA
jgi:IS605 OrfB family transposase